MGSGLQVASKGWLWVVDCRCRQMAGYGYRPAGGLKELAIDIRLQAASTSDSWRWNAGGV
jgi:hypothetical protein